MPDREKLKEKLTRRETLLGVLGVGTAGFIWTRRGGQTGMLPGGGGEGEEFVDLDQFADEHILSIPGGQMHTAGAVDPYGLIDWDGDGELVLEDGAGIEFLDADSYGDNDWV